MKKVYDHLKTVLRHKYYVCKYCWRMGLWWQGIAHDSSKFSPTEFKESIKYYRGYRSPIGVARESQGYSMAWVHHLHSNKHHPDYWIDRDKKDICIKMPARYFKEMMADVISASMVYNGENFDWGFPLKYAMKERKKMHPKTKKAFFHFLKRFAKKGEVVFDELKDFQY